MQDLILTHLCVTQGVKTLVMMVHVKQDDEIWKNKHVRNHKET